MRHFSVQAMPIVRHCYHEIHIMASKMLLCMKTLIDLRTLEQPGYFVAFVIFDILDAACVYRGVGGSCTPHKRLHALLSIQQRRTPFSCSMLCRAIRSMRSLGNDKMVASVLLCGIFLLALSCTLGRFCCARMTIAAFPPPQFSPRPACPLMPGMLCHVADGQSDVAALLLMPLVVTLPYLCSQPLMTV